MLTPPSSCPSSAPSQTGFDFAALLPPVVDQRVPRRRHHKLGEQAQAIIDALRVHAMTNRAIAAMFPDGTAWRTRVSDARRHLERTTGETITCRPLGDGLFIYEIAGLA